MVERAILKQGDVFVPVEVDQDSLVFSAPSGSGLAFGEPAVLAREGAEDTHGVIADLDYVYDHGMSYEVGRLQTGVGPSS